MTTAVPVDAAELELHELEAHFAASGLPRFHGRQIFQWIHRRGVTDIAQMTDLGRELRQSLPGQLSIQTPAVVNVERSTDGTAKFLLELADGHLIESVFIPDTPSQTLLPLDAGRLRHEMRVLPHRAHGHHSESDGGRDRRPGASAAARARHARPALQHRADGDGRAAPQLRRDDEGAEDPGRPAGSGA